MEQNTVWIHYLKSSAQREFAMLECENLKVANFDIKNKCNKYLGNVKYTNIGVPMLHMTCPQEIWLCTFSYIYIFKHFQASIMITCFMIFINDETVYIAFV